MEQELNRIKNKDLTKMDQRLFASLDKIQTIDSTLQNLGQFQQFLLQQITQFEQKAKQKNHDKEVTEVIQQNCTTLRQSIMRVVPELQQNTSRLRMSHLSPVNRFRSTGFQKWKALDQQKNKQIQQRVQLESKESKTSIESECKIQLNHLLREKVQKLKEQLRNMKSCQFQLNKDISRIQTGMKNQCQRLISVELKVVIQQNVKLRCQIQSLKLANSQLFVQKSTLEEQINKLKDVIKKQNNQQKQKTVDRNNVIQINKDSDDKQQKENKTEKKEKYTENKENYTEKKEYKSFMDKIKSDFSIKLKNNYLPADYENTIEQPSTFRQSANLKDKNIELHNNIQHHPFRSVEMTRDIQDKLNDKDLNVPKLLRRNSVLGNQILYQTNSNNVSHQSNLKSKLPINQLNHQLLLCQFANIKSKSIYQQHQPTAYQTQLQKHQSNSSSKKTNHDLMRKTKSNFFTNSTSNKQNYTQSKIQFQKTNLFNSKELISQKPQPKKRSQSKQKLKIISLL